MLVWFTLIVIVGGSYLYYRYQSVSNKKIFFTSTLFISTTGSLALILFSIIIVNNFAPVYVEPIVADDRADTLSAEETDTTYFHMAARGSAFHYRFISKICKNYNFVDVYAGMQAQYKKYLSSADANTISLGTFCLGVIALKRKDTKTALNFFNKVTTKEIPYFHYSLGELYEAQKQEQDACREYTRELSVEDGNIEACANLLRIYESSENYVGLYDLLGHQQSEQYFPEQVARITLLRNGDLLTYTRWIIKSIINKISLPGFIAALAIMISWFFYIVRLDVFKNISLSLPLMVVAGMSSVFPVMFFNDTMDTVSKWSLDGAFFNDIFYCFLMIGIPEEFVKFFPLLIVYIFFSRQLREPIDYILFACASALGFSFVENLLYFDEIKNGVIHGRAYFSVIGHMVDASIVAYGFVIGKFQLKKPKRLRFIVLLSFLCAAFVHGVYDFLIFHDHIYLFFIFFIFVIQVWVIIINNCLNNARQFNYPFLSSADRSRISIALSLTIIFVMEYFIVGFTNSKEVANGQVFANIPFAGFLIIFFSSNLSSFDLVRNYWRPIYLTSPEKRGYGSRQSISPLISWYFINSIKAHNYVGLKVKLCNDPYNKILAEILDGYYEGVIINRLVLYEDDIADPNWFIVKLTRPIPFSSDMQNHVIVKLRYLEDSLIYEDDVEIFLKGIPDESLLRSPEPQKKDFPFYGWALLNENR